MSKLLSYKSNGANLLKRSIAFILSGAISIPSLVPGNISERKKNVVYAATESVTYGDVNSDGKISVLDMIALKSYIIENNTQNFSIKAADLDNDGKVSSKDAVELSMYLMNEIPVFSSEKNVDSDGDGLYDYQETILGTDKLKKDTDGDGLNDYTESFLSLTDPLTKDTGKTGISDDKRDIDNDGLINLDEQKYGTNPLNNDTDNDDIDDYSEINGTNGYKSNPIKEDTDGDGLTDSEEIRIKLDPSKASTDGKINDNKRIISQSIKSDNPLLKEINGDSVYQLSVDASVSGYIENSITIKESSFSATIDYDGVYGKKIDVEISDQRTLASDGLKLNFKLSGTDIEKYMVFKYYDDLNMIFPIPTEYDNKNSVVYCLDDTDGTYCLVEKDVWRKTIAAEPKSYRKPAGKQNNLVLFSTDAVLENSGFNTGKYITQIAEKLYDSSYNNGNLLSSEVGIFGFSKALKQNVTASSFDVYGGAYFNQYAQLESFFVEDDFIGLSEYSMMCMQTINSGFLNSSSSMVVPMKMALDASKRELEESFDNIFVFSLSANNYDLSNRLDDDTINEIIGLNNLHGSYVISTSASDTAKEYYTELANTFHGKLFYYNDTENNIADSINEYIKRETTPISPVDISYFNYSSFIDPAWKDDVLNEDFDSIGDVKDTDGDGLYDLAEVNWNLFDGQKTYSDYADESYTKSNKPKKGIEQLFDGTVVETRRYVPFVSDIEEFDTDNDGLYDNEEIECFGTDVRKADTDGDGLSDGEEVELWYDPLNANPDNDSFSDKEEYVNDTNPYFYDPTIGESSLEFIKGAIIGDFDVPDTVTGLIGQISASFVPVAADVRDYFANVFVNQDSKAAIWNVFGWSMDLIPIAGVSVDGAKVISKVSKFVSKFSDDIPKVFEAISKALRLPGFNKLTPQLAGAVPMSSLDNIAKAMAEGSIKVTKADFNQAKTIFKAANKAFDIGTDLKPQKLLDELIESGVKCNYNEIIGITKMSDGKLVWLEKGHLGDKASGFVHVLEEHEQDFLNRGITKDELPEFLLNTIEKGKIVGYQGKGTGRPIFEYTYKGKTQQASITIGSNGYIVGANPTPKK